MNKPSTAWTENGASTDDPFPITTSNPTGWADRLALDTVYEIAKLFAAAPDPVQSMPAVFNVLSGFIGLHNGSLSLLVEPTEGAPQPEVNPYVLAATGLGTPEVEGAHDYVPDAVAQMVFRTGVPLVSWDLSAEFGLEAVPERLRERRHSLLAVPVREQFRSQFVIGVLAAYRCHEVDFAGQSKNDLNVMTMVASLLEHALGFRHSVARDRARAMDDNRRALGEMRERLEAEAPAADVTLIDGIVGTSARITDVIERIQKVASTSAPVLLRGESGTGKELFARALHDHSSRRGRSFVRVNCAALSETLLESELFGHEKGAFTGAATLKKGRFELADGGTLFLDEIGEISAAFQAKLLRVLQEGEFERVGGTKTMKVDVRLVTATNRDLEAAVAQGEFRADLYFRICVVPILLPPLRERPGDIKALAEHFLQRFNEDNET
ncbi:MAG: sigma 54-interacting transcriptional regulator, partial [Pseudomonadota bacterium]